MGFVVVIIVIIYGTIGAQTIDSWLYYTPKHTLSLQRIWCYVGETLVNCLCQYKKPAPRRNKQTNKHNFGAAKTNGERWIIAKSSFFCFFYFFYRGGFCHAHPHHSHQSPSKTAKHWINVIVALWRFHLHDKLRQIVVGCCSTFSNLCIKCDVNEPFCVHQLNDKLIHFLANFSHS